MMNEHMIVVIFVSFLFFYGVSMLLYKTMNLPKAWTAADPTYQAEWSNRLVAVSHATGTVLVIMCVCVCFSLSLSSVFSLSVCVTVFL